MAVFSKQPPFVDGKDQKASMQALSDYIRLMQEQIEFSVTTINNRLGGLSDDGQQTGLTIEAIGKSISSINESISGIQSEIKSINSSISSMKKRLDALEGA